MRGIGRGHARLPVAAVLLAGVLLTARFSDQAAVAQTTDPAIPVGREQGLMLPHPLPAAEARRLRHVFALQARGDMAGAARAAAWLDDGSPLGQAMFGDVLAERYLNPATRPDAAVLQDWLRRFADLPDAPAVRRLLLARLPAGEAPPAPIAAPAAPPVATGADDDATEGPRRNPELDRDVHALARARGAAAVLHLLGRTEGLGADYAALLRGEAARILFTLGRDDDAIALGAGAPGRRAALAGFAAGLAAWRTGAVATAGALFAAGWDAPIATPALRAACAFWAGRAAAQQDDTAGFLGWTLRAAEQPRSFYGLLARRRLGLALPGLLPAGERPTLGPADIAALRATAPGLRAFALLQIGQTARAAAELRLLLAAARQSRGLARAAVLLAAQAHLPDVAEDFADALAAADGHPHPPAHVKLPELRPASGFRIDPAMLYGIARAESNFDPAMVSSAGALGILQIMPETARDMLGHPLAGRAALLDDPAFNLDLGQRYIVFLAGQEPVNGDLIRLLASYNAGLGSFARWAPLIRDNGDPLLFIEAIPIDETRNYVPRVLTWTWLYAARLHLPAPSLDELAAGRWPRYHPRDTVTGDAAWPASTRIAASSP